MVFPVSSRAALAAKVATRGETTDGPLTGDQVARLRGNSDWMSSGFSDLEQYMVDFLAGGEGDKLGECARLKLQTPLVVA